MQKAFRPWGRKAYLRGTTPLRARLATRASSSTARLDGIYPRPVTVTTVRFYSPPGFLPEAPGPCSERPATPAPTVPARFSPDSLLPVSYTHLTLPTIYAV